MLDIKFIRNNIDLVQSAISNKNEKADLKKLQTLDEQKRKIQFEFDTLRSEQKKISNQIPMLKKAKQSTEDIMNTLQNISGQIKELSSQLNEKTIELDNLLLKIPNIPASDVPVGSEENNLLIKEWGEKKVYDFKLKDHLELALERDLLIFDRATKISGSGFVGYQKKGALLERALINFMLDFHIKKHDYQEVLLPILVNRKTMTGTGQLPKLEEDMYHINEDDLFLIPTAEVSVTNLPANEIISFNELPLKYVSYSSCFRREAGSYGKDTKGLQRLHQFNKVEMVRIVRPECSYQVLDEMLIDAEDILQALGLPYRVLILATGDLSFASAKTYDLEVWSPGSQRYLEVSSISNFEDFQARRASIRFRDDDGKIKFVHTLNGSGLATPRTFIALIENYQKPDGSIEIPSVLKPYMHDLDYL
jgi:seryl-tRNA synthetase